MRGKGEVERRRCCVVVVVGYPSDQLPGLQGSGFKYRTPNTEQRILLSLDKYSHKLSRNDEAFGKILKPDQNPPSRLLGIIHKISHVRIITHHPEQHAVLDDDTCSLFALLGMHHNR